MSSVANPAFLPSPADLRRLNRAQAWSIGLHAAVVVAFLVIPRDWISKPPQKVLTISLAGGTSVVRTTGTTQIGGRTVEQVAPQPKRPEPIRPIPTAQPTPMPVPAKPSPQTAKPAETSKPETTPTRPVVTGPQVSRGSTQVDTGARGTGVGLTQSSGGTGGETDLRNFCCPEYLALLRQRIDYAWTDKRQPEKGETIIRFTLRRDGTVDPKIEVVQSSGSGILDRASRGAILSLKMSPLPAAYPENSLTVRVNFPYEGN